MAPVWFGGEDVRELMLGGDDVHGGRRGKGGAAQHGAHKDGRRP
jgi:hypothetical protein